MGRVFAAILLVVVLVIGGGIIANTAYQAGLSTAVTAATGSGATVVTPVVVPAAGYGWGWNPFGWFFGFIATLFFLFIVFGLIRAIVWGGRRGHHDWGDRGGWGGKGGWSDHGGSGHQGSRWESRAHETFEDWHRRAHGDPPASAADDPKAPTGVA